MKKGIVYYTCNVLEETFAKVIRERLKLSAGDIPIVWTSLKPIPEENNIVWEMKRSRHTRCFQILSGLQALDVDVVFFAEHDVIYHPSHFEFEPLRSDLFYYNINRWWLNADNGETSFDHKIFPALSQIVADRKLLESHYQERLRAYESGINVRKVHGTEPGKRKGNILTNHGIETFCSQWPNVDVRHDRNLTKVDRFTEEYILADGVPFWGKTKGRYKEFICNCIQ